MKSSLFELEQTIQIQKNSKQIVQNSLNGRYK